jgi:hypothetical protein
MFFLPGVFRKSLCPSFEGVWAMGEISRALGVIGASRSIT